jgi:hypothetical protein
MPCHTSPLQDDEVPHVAAVSLSEAASLRAVVHQSVPLLRDSGAKVVLLTAQRGVHLASWGLTGDESLPRSVHGALQTLRYFNSDAWFAPRELLRLVESLTECPLEMRRSFYRFVRNGRRREDVVRVADVGG